MDRRDSSVLRGVCSLRGRRLERRGRAHRGVSRAPVPATSGCNDATGAETSAGGVEADAGGREGIRSRRSLRSGRPVFCKRRKPSTSFDGSVRRRRGWSIHSRRLGHARLQHVRLGRHPRRRGHRARTSRRRPPGLVRREHGGRVLRVGGIPRSMRVGCVRGRRQRRGEAVPPRAQRRRAGVRRDATRVRGGGGVGSRERRIYRNRFAAADQGKASRHGRARAPREGPDDDERIGDDAVHGWAAAQTDRKPRRGARSAQATNGRDARGGAARGQNRRGHRRRRQRRTSRPRRRADDVYVEPTRRVDPAARGRVCEGTDRARRAHGGIRGTGRGGGGRFRDREVRG